MTNERAVEILNLDLDILGQYGCETAEAYKMAIKALKKQQDELVECDRTSEAHPTHGSTYGGVSWGETYKEKSQPCEDCISRQAVIDFIIDNYGVGFNSLTNGIRDYLPSVTSKRPNGKWIFCYGNRGKDNVEKCSCCKSYWKEAVIYRYDTQEYLRLRLKYCPNCGAEMSGGGEDE